MRCLVISVCQWHGDREKNSIILSRSISTYGPYKKVLPVARNSPGPLAENPYPGDIPVKAKHKTDPPITEKNLFGLGIILFRNRSLVYRFLRNKLL